MRRLPIMVALILLAGGCGSTPPAPQPIVVFAAASLRPAFTELAAAFQAANPDAAVEFSFAGTADLLAQLTGGAGADVFASADTASMDRAVDAAVVDDPVAFATNTLTIVAAPGNPRNIRTFGDLRRVSVVACAPQVPCGAALIRIEDATGVDVAPVSEESSVTDVLNKILTGQADAGLVYVTDARAAAGKVTAVPIREAPVAVNTYRIAATRDAHSRAAAMRFVELVTGPTGREILRRAGFGAP